jgi:hypothetical protein
MSKLKQKPDRSEMQKLLKDLSTSMKNSVKAALAMANADESDNAMLQTRGGTPAPMQSQSTGNLHAGMDDTKHYYANLVWKKGQAVSGSAASGGRAGLMNADRSNMSASFGGGFNLGASARDAAAGLPISDIGTVFLEMLENVLHPAKWIAKLTLVTIFSI